MKTYMIILDGAADRKIEAIGGRTPLEVASKPALDNLADRGVQSLISIIDNGIVPESDSGTMALLSYDPLFYYPGRGTLEGIGSGLTEGYRFHASFRINFASYDSARRILDRRTARDLSDEELQELADTLRREVFLEKTKDVEFRLVAFGKHRGILSLVSNKIELSGNVTNTDPGFSKMGCFSVPVSNYKNEILPCRPMDSTKAAENTAYYINLFSQQSHAVLVKSKINEKRRQQKKMEANCILVRDGGRMPNSWPQFFHLYKQTLGLYGQLPSEKAIAVLAGADFTYTKALELQLEPEYLTQLAQKLLTDVHDIVYIHLKGPDEPGHDQLPFEKVRAIEIIDQYFITELLKSISSDDFVIITCDHATPCELGIHSADLVPLLIYGPGIEPDERKKFSELDATLGNGSIKRAVDIFPYLNKHFMQIRDYAAVRRIGLRRILNSNGDQTVEAEVFLENDNYGRASAPSAIIPGKRERKTSSFRENGNLIEMEQQLNEVLLTESFCQETFDYHLDRMVAQNGTDITLPLSVAFARAISAAQKIDLVDYLHQRLNMAQTMKIPRILVPVFSAGVHQPGQLDSFQQMMVCIEHPSLLEMYKISGNISQIAEIRLREKNHIAGLAASGGFLTEGLSTEEKLSLLDSILTQCQCEGHVSLAIDVAAEHISERGFYRIDGKLIPSQCFYDLLTDYIQRFSIDYIEDPFVSDDIDLWCRLMKEFGKNRQIIGDDLFATQVAYVKPELCTGAVIKMNQVGNLTGTLDMIRTVRKSGMTLCVSHRSYETEDTAMCDLAVAAAAEYIKIGSIKRGERIIKYNQLLRLEEKLWEAR